MWTSSKRANGVPPEERGGVEIVREIMALSAGGSETPGARRKGKGGRVVLTLFTVQRSGGPMPDTVSDSVRRAMLASLVRSAHPSSASSHSRRPAIDSIAIRASPTLGLSVFSTPKRKLPALQKFRRQTFLKGAGDLFPANNKVTPSEETRGNPNRGTRAVARRAVDHEDG